MQRMPGARTQPGHARDPQIPTRRRLHPGNLAIQISDFQFAAALMLTCLARSTTRVGLNT